MDYEVDTDKNGNKDDEPEKDENIEDKFSEYPIRKRNRFKTFKEPFPFTPPEKIKLYPYNIKKPFKSFRLISARLNNTLESNAAINDVNDKLKEKASKLGANAVIAVRYEQGILTLFRGIRGVGRAVYIEDLENVEKANPPSGYLLFFGVFWVIMGLPIGSNDYHQFFIPIGLSMVIFGVSNRKGYINKTFFLAFLSIVLLYGLMLGRYIFKNGIQLYNLDFYFSTGLFAVLLITFVYSYKRRKNDPNLEWRDNWGIK